MAGTSLVAISDYDYDDQSRITHILHTDPTAATIDQFTYDYNDAGYLHTAADNAGTITYTNDAAGQLTGDGVTSYNYDEGGNRVGGAYGVGDGNQITGDADWTYSYDLKGNLTGKDTTTPGSSEHWVYDYDNRNELTQAEHFDATNASVMFAEYKYDIFGNRLEKIVDGTATKFAVDGWNSAKQGAVGNENFNVFADLDAGGSLTTHYLYGDETDELLARIDGTTPRWYLRDHQGSIRDVIDNGGAVKDALRYDGFGNITYESDINERGRYAWTGREIDVEIEMQYNRARYYDASTGRWISQDPLGFDAGDSNLYRYVNNRATTAVDPSGLVENGQQPQAAEKVAINSNGAAKMAPNHVDIDNAVFIKKADLQAKARDIAATIRELKRAMESVKRRQAIVEREIERQPLKDLMSTAGRLEIVRPRFGGPDTVVYRFNTAQLIKVVERDDRFFVPAKGFEILVQRRELAEAENFLTETLYSIAFGQSKTQMEWASYNAEKERQQKEADFQKAVAENSAKQRFDPSQLAGRDPAVVRDEIANSKRVREIEHSLGTVDWDWINGRALTAGPDNGALTKARAQVRQLQFELRDRGVSTWRETVGGFIPVVGSLMNVCDAIERGHWGSAIFSAAFFAFDIFTFPTMLGSAVKFSGATARFATSAESRKAVFDSFRASTREFMSSNVNAGGITMGPGINGVRFGAAELIVTAEGVILATGCQAGRSVAERLAGVSCFIAGTMLLTPDGEKPIELFRTGDRILSRAENDPDGAVEVKTVERIFVRESRIMSLRVRGRDIRTTPEHPFYVEGEGWQCAHEIRIGDRLSSHDGQWCAVEGVYDTGEVATVYNLRVSDYHTYFVGGDDWGFSVWAHNANYVPIPLPGGGYRLVQVEANGTLRLAEGVTHANLDAAIAAARSIPGGAIAESVGILTRAHIERILAVPAAATGSGGGRAGGQLLREVAGLTGSQSEKAAALEAGTALINARFGEGSFTFSRIQNPNGGWILFEGRAPSGGGLIPVAAIHPDGRVFRATAESLSRRGNLVTFDPYVGYRPNANPSQYAQEFIDGVWANVPAPPRP